MEHFNDIRGSRKVCLGPTLCLFSVGKGAGFWSKRAPPMEEAPSAISLSQTLAQEQPVQPEEPWETGMALL